MAWECNDIFFCTRDDVNFCNQRAKKAINQNFDKCIGGNIGQASQSKGANHSYRLYFISFLPLELVKVKGFLSLIQSKGFTRYYEKISHMGLRMRVHTCNPTFERLKQQDHEFKRSLGNNNNNNNSSKNSSNNHLVSKPSKGASK